jgi:RNA polymerase sigma-70 factor (ECF subfamily)
MPASRQAETLSNVENRIVGPIRVNESDQMGTTIREGSYVFTARRRRLENRSTDVSNFQDIGQRERTVPGEEPPLHQPQKAVLAEGANRPSSADGDVASGNAVFRKPAEDALKSGLASAGHESSVQAAEGALIDRILSGHKDLFMDLIRPHQRTVYATVFTLLANKEDAEDVAQDALLKALARLSQFRKESTFGTWLIQIAINEARMRNRKQWRIPMLSLTNEKDDARAYVPKDFEDWREIPSTALERAEVRDALVKALASLAQHYREAFVLRDIHELSISETSAILGISGGAVKSRLRRARLMLRDILAPGLGPDGWLGWASKEVRKPWE